MMPEIKMCPECGVKLEEIKTPAKYGPAKKKEDLPEQWIYKYSCSNCKKEFSEDDLS